MTFENLPQGFADHPLDPAQYADVVDLFFTSRDRAADSLLLVCVDAERRIWGDPILVGGVDWEAPHRDRRAPFAMLADHFPEIRGMLVATGHPRGRVTRHDRSWMQSIRQILKDLDVELLGMFAATGQGVFAVEAREAA